MQRAGIGHNMGPTLEGGRGWQRHCWTRARRELLGNRVPIEIVRTRVNRARQLGLSYPQYASILLGTGRDVVAFLFTVDGLQLRLRRRLEMPLGVQHKLQGLGRCDLTSFAPSGEDPEGYRIELEDVSGVRFAGTAAEPEPPVAWRQARLAVRSVLDPMRLPGNAVVMIGARDREEEMANAAGLARFIATPDYFAGAAAG